MLAAGTAPTLDLESEIRRLKKERHAVILAHYYQDSEIQDVADELGDSLYLAQCAQRAREEVIVFCGVHFMAETAKILNPGKIVVLPDLDAGCSLADSCPASQLAAWRRHNPRHVVVSYINCSAAVKALSDIICTSSNAERVIASIPAGTPILFAPDRNLGAWLVKKTGRDMTLWQGTCMVHEIFSEKALVQMRAEHPEAKVIAHPECEPRLLKHADFIGSTSALLKFTQTDSAPAYIIGTEAGILHQMRLKSPAKTFLELPTDEGCACNRCPHMQKNTLEKLYRCLRDLEPRIEMDPALMAAARTPLTRMLELG